MIGLWSRLVGLRSRLSSPLAPPPHIHSRPNQSTTINQPDRIALASQTSPIITRSHSRSVSRDNPNLNLTELDPLRLWGQSGLGPGAVTSLGLVGTIPPSTLFGLAQSHIQTNNANSGSTGSPIVPTDCANVLILTASQSALHHQLLNEANQQITDSDHLDTRIANLLSRIDIWLVARCTNFDCADVGSHRLR